MGSRRVPGVRRVTLLGGVGALLLGAALLLASMHATAAGTCSGRNGKVAVVSHPGLRRDAIGVLKSNHRIRVLYKGEPEKSLYDLFFSCDGKMIVFIEIGAETHGFPSKTLRILDLSTGEAPIVPTQRLKGSSPAFLPNGRVLFSGWRGTPEPAGGTFVVRPDGSGLHHLFGHEQLAVSPDRRWFVATIQTKIGTGLYLLNAKGKRVGGPLTPPGPPDTDFVSPTFSPDGKLIVFEERRFPLSRAHGILYVERRDGTHRRRLTFGPETACEPAFSPDGRWIVFTRSEEKGPDGNVYALLLKDPSKVRQLGLSWAYQYPAWGPR